MGKYKKTLYRNGVIIEERDDDMEFDIIDSGINFYDIDENNIKVKKDLWSGTSIIEWNDHNVDGEKYKKLKDRMNCLGQLECTIILYDNNEVITSRKLKFYPKIFNINSNCYKIVSMTNEDCYNVILWCGKNRSIKILEKKDDWMPLKKGVFV